MAKVLIVYDPDPDTEVMAESIVEGLYSVSGTDAVMKKASQATADDVLGCEGFAFGSPTVADSMSGELKGFFDRIGDAVRGKVGDKPYFAFGILPISGEKGVLGAIDSACADLGLRKLGEGIGSKGQPSPIFLTGCYDLGSKLAREAAK